MSRKSDESHVAAIKEACDRLYDACQAAVEAALDVSLDADEVDRGDVPTVYAYISRHYGANP